MATKRTNCRFSLILASLVVNIAVPSGFAEEAKSRPLKLPGLRLLNPYKQPVVEIAQTKSKTLALEHQTFAVPQNTGATNQSPNPNAFAPGNDSTRYVPGSTVGSFNQSGALSIGKILIKPSGAISYSYESNLLALSGGHQPDRSYTLAPTVEAFIPFTQNGIRFEYSMLYRDYRRFDLRQKFDHVFNADSEFNISPILSVAVRDHFSMSSINAQEYMPGRELIFSDSRFKRNDLGLRANWTISQNDSLGLAASWNRVFFDKASDDWATPFYNFDQYGFEGTYKRDVSERFGVFATGSYRQNSTRDPRDVANSKGFSIMGGIDGSITPLMSAQFGIGFSFDRYPGAVKTSATGMVVRGSLSKEISERSQVSLSLSRASNISNFQQNAYFETTGVGVSYNRDVRPNIGIFLSSSYQRNGYPLPLQAGFGIPDDLIGRKARADDFVDFGLGAQYRYNDWLAMDVRFEITRRFSDLSQFRFQSYRGVVNFLIGSRGSGAGRSPY